VEAITEGGDGMRTTRTWLTRVVIGLGALALLLPGGAAAQDEPADPQQMCADAGGEWNGVDCLNVWCGWADDPPICAWMGMSGDAGSDAPEPAPATSESASLPRTQPAPATAGTPGYTG
jgi:hypothetical protein